MFVLATKLGWVALSGTVVLSMLVPAGLAQGSPGGARQAPAARPTPARPAVRPTPTRPRAGHPAMVKGTRPASGTKQLPAHGAGIQRPSARPSGHPPGGDFRSKGSTPAGKGGSLPSSKLGPGPSGQPTGSGHPPLGTLKGDPPPSNTGAGRVRDPSGDRDGRRGDRDERCCDRDDRCRHHRRGGWQRGDATITTASPAGASPGSSSSSSGGGGGSGGSGASGSSGDSGSVQTPLLDHLVQDRLEKRIPNSSDKESEETESSDRDQSSKK
jgi:hypothetical protein